VKVIRNNLFVYLAFSIFATGWLITPAGAEDAMLQADEAVADILFDYDFDASFASYSANDNGFVSISFASDMPDELYSEVLNRLKKHPEIKGVLAGKTLPPCRAW
jgi:hypothetical protein